LTAGPGPAASPADAVGLFDVEQFRGLRLRYAVARRVGRPTLVLGSTQRDGVVRSERAADAGVAVVRRHGGGGAVLLRPGDHLWFEAWIPRDDPLWQADVAAAAVWVGDWWASALSDLGVVGCAVHQGAADPGRDGALVCFSGRGAGEVCQAGRKVMGLSQWRSREGALFHACTYAVWDPAPLVDLLEVEPAQRGVLAHDLAGTAVGLAQMDPPGPGLAALEEILLTTFPAWK
jgi:lipoate-protein ligase A